MCMAWDSEFVYWSVMAQVMVRLLVLAWLSWGLYSELDIMYLSKIV